MPMIAGVVTINPATGTASPKTGAAGAVFDVLDAGQDYGTLSSTNPIAYAAAREQIAVMARAIAALVPYIQTNAQVPLGIPVTTAGTASAQTGATTAPGTIV
jgi:hypothetical protein